MPINIPPPLGSAKQYPPLGHRPNMNVLSLRIQMRLLLLITHLLVISLKIPGEIPFKRNPVSTEREKSIDVRLGSELTVWQGRRTRNPSSSW